MSLLLAYATGGVGIGLVPALACEGLARERVALERAEMPLHPVRLVTRTLWHGGAAAERFVAEGSSTRPRATRRPCRRGLRAVRGLEQPRRVAARDADTRTPYPEAAVRCGPAAADSCASSLVPERPRDRRGARNGEHLAWGYPDFPPLTAFQAWLTRALFGDSPYSIRRSRPRGFTLAEVWPQLKRWN